MKYNDIDWSEVNEILQELRDAGYCNGMGGSSNKIIYSIIGNPYLNYNNNLYDMISEAFDRLKDIVPISIKYFIVPDSMAGDYEKATSIDRWHEFDSVLDPDENLILGHSKIYAIHLIINMSSSMYSGSEEKSKNEEGYFKRIKKFLTFKND